MAGKEIANPIGQIWSAAMMLDHLGYKKESQNIVRAIEEVLKIKKYKKLRQKSLCFGIILYTYISI